MSWYRKWAVTKKGYFCSVPPIAKPTDQIWVVNGCTAPLVLRPSAGRGKSPQGRYQLVGTGFVHGVMSGEYLDNPEYKLRGVTLY